ncbi:MAG TPA: hypothetical protein VFM98_08520 [Ramlibacter sp.]|uniref:hypothetical protein n=1 Tax=Ramlibacter sp. TaxID=1917967 RepID=UPI002D7F3143|nr:hypothetical protein [Ramlibacter sp.]HET8745635.1 hypothetical protein [Ramlibacter sp.]
MSSLRPPPGLSFEVAPPTAAHPLRTDVACFVGTVARRQLRAPSELRTMPNVLARWLVAHRIDSVGGIPVAQLRVSLASGARFAETVVARASTAGERAALSNFLAAQTGGSTSKPVFAELLKACRTLTPVPDALVDELRERGFQPRGFLGTDELAAWLRLQRLHNLPVALGSFDTFDALFAWDQRGIRDRKVRDDDPVLATPLGVAVRAFFGEGGRRCYLIRSGDPSDVFDTRVGRFAACFPERVGPSAPTVFDDDVDRCPQLPGIRRRVLQGELKGLLGAGQPVALSAADWVGLEHVYGLDDVSFAVLPDLIDACARPLPSTVPPAEVVAADERFVECVEEVPPASLPVGRRLPLPRLDAAGLEAWRQLQLRALDVLENGGRAFHRRDVQLLASLPLLADAAELPPAAKWIAWMAEAPGWIRPAADGTALLSDRLQLAYPWIRTGDSADAQGGAEAPEGTLAGVLARSALERGAYRSAATRALHRFQDAEPPLAWTQATQQAVWTPLGLLTLAERVCLLGPTPRGPRLLSDVTCSADPRTRQGAVRRLLNVVIQASREAGNDLGFEPNGEWLWARVRERLSDLMRVLVTGGALSTDGVPFVVRCGRDTMRQDDIDAGRLVAQVEILPAQPVQRIVVVLNLRDAGAASAFANAA